MSVVSTLNVMLAQEAQERQAMLWQLVHEFNDVSGPSDLAGPITQAVRWVHSFYGTARLPND